MPKLTERFIASFAPEPGKKDRLAFDTECRGFGIRATAGGGRVLIVQWTDRATGRKVREPLGAWGSVTLAQAREAARAILGRVAQGVDLRAERNAMAEREARERAETALTFGALVERWATLHLAHRRPRYAAEAQRAIRTTLAANLRRPAARLTKAEVVGVLDGLATDSPAMAGRCMAYGRAAFSWAQKRGMVSGNPFAGLPIGVGSEARERVLTAEETGRVWRAASAMPQPWGPLFRVLILSLARRNEVAGMRWSEVSADLSTWAIPGQRMKRAAGHVVTLPEAARDALRDVTRIEGCDFVFSTTGRTPPSGFAKAKAALDKASGVSGWRLHDIRRTGVSALAKMGFNPIVADKLLAHQPGTLSAVARVYQRHDFAAERKAALEAWARHVLASADGGEPSVTDLAAHRAKRSASA